jgi:hypothetical protein
MDNRWPKYSMGILLASAGVGALAVLHRWYARALLSHGMQLVADRHYVRAVRVLRRAVVVTPDEPRAHYYLSLAYAGAGNFGPWLNHLEVAMRRVAVDTRVHEARSRAPGSRTAKEETRSSASLCGRPAMVGHGSPGTR